VAVVVGARALLDRAMMISCDCAQLTTPTVLVGGADAGVDDADRPAVAGRRRAGVSPRGRRCPRRRCRRSAGVVQAVGSGKRGSLGTAVIDITLSTSAALTPRCSSGATGAAPFACAHDAGAGP
jgi:hypothetical protein